VPRRKHYSVWRRIGGAWDLLCVERSPEDARKVAAGILPPPQAPGIPEVKES
jgi:hypothetical protein